MVTEPPTPLDSGMGKAILEALSEISAQITQVHNDVAEVKSDIDSIKRTNELQSEAFLEWKPQLSNEVKSLHGKLDAAEKR